MPTPTTRSTASEEHRFAVSAEDGLHRRANLIERAVGASAVENERHKVLRSLRRFAQIIETHLHQIVVAVGSHLRHAAPLLAFRLFGDLEQLDLELGLVGDEVVHADNYTAMLLDLPLLARGRLIDLPLQPSGFQTAHDASDFFDLPE